ncbi:MAG: TIR domain-containing protein [Lachnospiraceae bacterium]
MEDKNSVFISYSSKDRGFVNQIVDELEKMGVSCWRAPEMIPAGSSYAKEIPQAIQNCNVFLLVLSPNSQNSIWVEKEIDSAICNRKTIIPFQIKTVQLNDTFRFYLNNVQMISYIDNPNQAFTELRQQICQLMPELDSGEQVSDESAKTADGSNKRILSIAANQKGNPNGKYGRSSNALRINRIPLVCQYCGGEELDNITMGTYRCVQCGRDNYDDFQTIRNYLEKAGATSAFIIERDTGVPRRIIEYFFRDEYLEIPKNSPVRVPCERCGAPIRTGTLCDNCKADPKNQSSDGRKGRWHSIW